MGALQEFSKALMGIELELENPESDFFDPEPPAGASKSKAVLFANRSLVIMQAITDDLITGTSNDNEKAMITEILYNQIKADCTAAISLEPNNIKALYRRAQAGLELNELGLALNDITKVVEHYAATSSCNPEAVALREKIIE